MEQGLLLLLKEHASLFCPLGLFYCYYVPSLSSNTTSPSYLDKEGFICVNGKEWCSIYKDDVYLPMVICKLIIAS